jgi:hypothetical protein
MNNLQKLMKFVNNFSFSFLITKYSFSFKEFLKKFLLEQLWYTFLSFFISKGNFVTHQIYYVNFLFIMWKTKNIETISEMK